MTLSRKPGHPTNSQIDSFRARIWYIMVEIRLQLMTAYAVEKHFYPIVSITLETRV